MATVYQNEPAVSLTTRKARTRWARARVVCLALVVWAIGMLTFCTIALADQSIHLLEWLSLILFGVLFGWIAFSFSLAMEGFLGRLSRSSGETEAKHNVLVASDVRTAILMPVYNESPTRVFAAVAAMREQLQQSVRSGGFDFYILSDTTSPDVWLDEEWCWAEMTERFGGKPSEEDLAADDVGVFYRHRAKNIARKAGNVADFCENWGSVYRYMIVLDADSLMTAVTMNEMVRRMESDSKMGILQVPPVPVGRRSLFARMQQFAAAAYGPMYAEGFDRFAGDQGNYWGHNAILRTAAFMRHCSLPVLAGNAPLGGEILSHDFVEAALMVRSGWKVNLANDLGGSYEECPTTILDFVKRDHRWCQGNLQHWQILIAERIHPLSRLHFLSGILSYVAAPLWLAFLAATIAAAWVNTRTEAAPWTKPQVGISIALFLGSMALLLLPKMLAVLALTLDPVKRRRLGGPLRIVGSACFETFLSTVLAPLIAVYHSRCVFSILTGNTVKWNAQQRSETSVSWTEASAQMWPLTLLGAICTAVLAVMQPAWLIWFAPLTIGWLFSIPLTVMLGSRASGMRVNRWGLLQIEAERHPQPIFARHLHYIREIEAWRESEANASFFHRLTHDNQFRERQLDILRRANGSETQAASPENDSPVMTTGS